MNVPCDPNANINNLRSKLKSQFLLPRSYSKNMSVQNACNILRYCKNATSLPPMKYVTTGDSIFLIDRFSPFTAKEYITLFKSGKKESLVKLAKKIGIVETNVTKEILKGMIVTSLKQKGISEPIKVPISLKTKAKKSSINYGNNNLTNATLNVNINAVNNAARNANLNAALNTNLNAARNANANANANATRSNKPKTNNSGEKKSFLSKMFGGGDKSKESNNNRRRYENSRGYYGNRGGSRGESEKYMTRGSVEKVIAGGNQTRRIAALEATAAAAAAAQPAATARAAAAQPAGTPRPSANASRQERINQVSQLKSSLNKLKTAVGVA